MDFADQLNELAKRADRQRDHLMTEEATKNALVLPFITALGYNPSNITEVIPEYTADHGVKKGEKVDYALVKDDKVVMLWECKTAGCDLDKVGLSQLYRYFSVTAARVGVLTDGIIYRFFADLEEPNKMDEKPFMEIDLDNLREARITGLKDVSKPQFDEENVLATAGELKYTNEIKRILKAQLHEPDDAFVELLTRQVYGGRITQSVRQKFSQTVRQAFRDFVQDQVTERLTSALDRDGYNTPDSDPSDSEQATSEADGIITTEEELEGFHIVRAILSRDVQPSRIVYRDVKSYFGILLDDNNRLPICRLHLNGKSRWHISLFDGPSREEAREPLKSIESIYGFEDRFRATLRRYLEEE